MWLNCIKFLVSATLCDKIIWEAYVVLVWYFSTQYILFETKNDNIGSTCLNRTWNKVWNFLYTVSDIRKKTCVI